MLHIDTTHTEIMIDSEFSHSIRCGLFSSSCIMDLESDIELPFLFVSFRMDNTHIRISRLTPMLDSIIQELIRNQSEFPSKIWVYFIFFEYETYHITNDLWLRILRSKVDWTFYFWYIRKKPFKKGYCIIMFKGRNVESFHLTKNESEISRERISYLFQKNKKTTPLSGLIGLYTIESLPSESYQSGKPESS